MKKILEAYVGKKGDLVLLIEAGKEHDFSELDFKVVDNANNKYFWSYDDGLILALTGKPVGECEFPIYVLTRDGVEFGLDVPIAPVRIISKEIGGPLLRVLVTDKRNKIWEREEFEEYLLPAYLDKGIAEKVVEEFFWGSVSLKANNNGALSIINKLS